jgi:hypothetical protein
MAAFIAASEVRDYLDISSTSGQYSDAVINSNIRAASGFLERQTGRQFDLQAATAKTFTTRNMAAVTIPDLQSVTSVVKADATLTANATYWLIPDRKSSGIYTSIAFRVPYRNAEGAWYLGNSEWWDRGYDMRSPYHYGSEWNDLVVTGTWGYNTDSTAPALPDELLMATKVLAAFYTKRPDSVLAGAQVTPAGALLVYREMPMEVRDFVDTWRLDEQVAAV